MAEFDRVTMFERPDLALARALAGDPKGIGRALLAPKDLSPSERQTLLEQYLPRETLESPYGKMLKVITNPLVLLGAVLAFRFPVAKIANITRATGQLEGYTRYLNPLAKWIGNLDDTFRGTALPDTMRRLSKSIMGVREKYLGEVSNSGLTRLLRQYEKDAGKALDSQTAYKIVIKLDGWEDKAHPLARRLGLSSLVQGSIRLDAPAAALYGQMKTKWFPGMFDDVLGPGTKDLRGILKSLRGSGMAVGNVDELKQLRDFWPHVTSASHDQMEAGLQALLAGEKRLSATAARKAGKITTVHAADRRHGMLPNRSDLRAMEPGVLHPDLMRLVEQEHAAHNARWVAGAYEGPPPREYSLAFIPTVERYVNSLSRAFGWTVDPAKYGAKVTAELKKVKALGAANPNAAMRAEMLENTYIPWAMGQRTLSQGIRAAEWSATKKWAFDKLDHPTLKKLVPADMRDKLREMITSSHALTSPGTVGGSLAGYFYLSALGLNPASAMLNSMQTIVTTYPLIGFGATVRGMGSALRKGEVYLRARAGGTSEKMAMAKAFPEFYEAGLTGAPVTEQAIGGMLEDSWRHVAGVRGMGAKVKGAMMSLFSGSEKFVRLTAFEGTRLQALREGVGRARSLEMAAQVTERTQFLPGVTGTPYGLINMNPALRQFAQFPLRMAGTVGRALGDRNYGMLGRMMMGSGAVYGAGKEFGNLDLSRGLMWGALPEPQRQGPFAPLPIVPPALSLGGAAVMDLASGRLKELPRQLPLLIPGGVGAARYVGMMPGGQDAAEVVGKDYAAYDQRDAEGKIPIFTSRGKLKGSFTPMQLALRGAGVKQVEGPAQEAEMAAYLVRQRDVIRDYRRRYVEAHYANDVPTAMRINTEFRGRYPELGDIQVKKSDLKALETRREVSRLESLLKTMPRESRPLFAGVVGTALVGRTAELAGSQPVTPLLQPGGPR